MKNTTVKMPAGGLKNKFKRKKKFSHAGIEPGIGCLNSLVWAAVLKLSP